MTQKINLKNKLKVMVALDLTKMDPILLKYVNFLCEVLNIDHLYFVHNIKQYKLLDLYDEFLEKGITVEDIVDRSLEKTIDQHYKASVPHSVLLTSDDYTESILTQLAKDYKIDIMITGNKDELQGTGGLSQKLVRMLDAHVLLVPEEAKHQLNKVLVPTDFSNASSRCFTVADNLIQQSKGEIEALHVYSIPSVFFPYINTDKAVDLTKSHLKRRVKQFRKRHKISEQLPFRYIDREDLSIVEAIESHADKGDFDIIVVSARGKSKLASLFIGSVTNDLIVRSRKMPLLIVR
ncbi:MAG TPA: universal stress protein [Flavobacteriaceae bacterium]|nr:universal stress protein [Flavobacteriaceae bacterium]